MLHGDDEVANVRMGDADKEGNCIDCAAEIGVGHARGEGMDVAERVGKVGAGD